MCQGHVDSGATPFTRVGPGGGKGVAMSQQGGTRTRRERLCWQLAALPLTPCLTSGDSRPRVPRFPRQKVNHG